MNVEPNAENAAVSTFRLYLLRAAYLLFAVGLAVFIWPGIIRPPADLPHLNAAIRSLLGGLSLLFFLGVRYPLKMLPMLLFELVWKSIWLLAFALPRWFAGQLDGEMQAEFSTYVISVILVAVVLPWRYMIRSYLTAPADRWRTSVRTAEPNEGLPNPA